jgi:hypothetical protein
MIIDNLVPGGVFHHINIVGGLKVPIYSPGIKYLVVFGILFLVLLVIIYQVEEKGF